jgi:hypothetical protein
MAAIGDGRFHVAAGAGGVGAEIMGHRAIKLSRVRCVDDACAGGDHISIGRQFGTCLLVGSRDKGQNRPDHGRRDQGAGKGGNEGKAEHG